MASGSALMPSVATTDLSPSMPNGHTLDLSSNPVNAKRTSSQSGSELSETKNMPPPPTPQPNGSKDTLKAQSKPETASSPSVHDEDAPGSEDADYETETLPPPPSEAHHMERTTSEESNKSNKRKSSFEDDEFILKDPELYGLRRSGRAKSYRRVIESSGDESASDVHNGQKRKKRRTAASGKGSGRPTPLVQSTAGEESDSDLYVGARRQILTKKQKLRQAQVAAGLAPPTQGEVRFSTRRAAKIASYNEDDEDPFSEVDSAALTPGYWNMGADETTPAIDLVLSHKLGEGSDPKDMDPSKHDFVYLIKWQGKAHCHASWEPFESVSSCRGFRKVENYFRKVVLTEVYMRHPNVPPEEKEKWNLDREREADALVDYQIVERVLGSRYAGDETEYFVKWKGLYYDSCTWEDAAFVSEVAQNEIDRFLDRSSRLPVSNKTESNIATRRAYKPFREQPAYIKGGELREFQIFGVNFLAHHWCKGNNVILADEMGLGKTVQTVAFMNWLRHDRQQQGPFLVVVPLSTMPAWAETFNIWTPDINYVVYNGNESARKIIREYELLVDGNPRRVKFHVLLTTYEYILADSSFLSQIKWQFMAVDEAHRLKNRESQLYAKLMDFGAPSRLLITGTPMQNTLGELSALMDFLMPGKVTVEENIDLQSETASQKIAELTNAISPYMIRRTKQKVENDLPPKTEKIIRVELSDIQLEYYKNILTRNYAALNAGAKGQKQSLLNIMMELKKASNHPFMFPNAEDRILAGSDRREDVLKGLITSSGKMMLLDQLLTKMRKDNHRVLIFSQMVRMLDILGDYLQLRGYQFQRLDGTIAAGPRRMAIDHFNAPDSQDFCFLLSTRAGGLGINLMTADTVILFDSDWNPQADLQAMARAHRIGQKNPVTIYRFVSKDTVEEEVLERARNKLMLEFVTIQRGVTDKDAKEFSDRITRAGHGVAEPTTSEDISRILKRRGQKMFEQSGNQEKLEALDIDAVLANAEEHKTEQPEGITADGGEDFLKSFEYHDVKIDLEWDEIIPKEQLDALKAEEKRKEDEKYLESVIEQNAPRKRKAPAADEREQRAAKKRARDLAAAEVAEDDVSSLSDAPSEDDDPKRPLNEKETRNLIRAYEKYGSLEDRGDEMLRDAKLVGRDAEVIKATLDEVIRISRRMIRAEQDRVTELERESQKTLTKKDKKAILFDYRGVKRLNAETLIERPVEMQMLKEVTEAASDWRNFRVAGASKPAHYTCDWGAREDGMLCVGIAKHGYGAWAAIRDDAALGMTDKFYLEEHRVDKKEKREKGDEKNAKSPGAVHLVRRANYLLSVLKDRASEGADAAARKALNNHHRNNRKGPSTNRRPEKSSSVSASPAPPIARKAPNGVDNARRRGHSHSEPGGPQPGRNGTSEVRRRPSGDGEEKLGRPGPEEEALRPVLAHLVRAGRATKSLMPDKEQRLKAIKTELLAIGNFISSRVPGGSSTEETLWDYVSARHWPQSKKGDQRPTGDKLREMYTRLVQKQAAVPARGGSL